MQDSVYRLDHDAVVVPFELSIAAPLLHDFLYRYGGKAPVGSVTPPRSYTRAEADRMFREIMRAEGVSAWRNLGQSVSGRRG